MKALKIIPQVWILLSLLFTIHINAQNTIIGYEYAFNNGEGLQFESVTPTPNLSLVTNIAVSGLTNSVNTIHMRFLDANGLWSSIISNIFIKPPEVLNNNASIVGYEYSFNNGEGMQFVSLAPTQDFNLMTNIDVGSLTNDVNIFHIRFLDDQGRWSSFISNIFIKPPEISNADANIVGYEYGFNDGEGLQFVSLPPSQDFNLIGDIDVSSLANDVNIFHIRFLDDQGRWSSFISKIFISPPNVNNSDASLVGYEYGFNDGEGIQFVPITATNDFNLVTDIDVSSLQNTMNQIHIRFLDDQGRWSSMISKIFIKPPEPLVYSNNALVSFDYWYNDDIASVVTVYIEPELENYTLSEIDVSQLWAGEYRLNTQFKDAYNNYSVVMTDTINKAVLPLANFTTDLIEICEGGTINFTNNSIDFDEQLWDFGDGNTSTLVNASHTFNTPGNYIVNLTIEDTTSGLTDAISQTIEVFEVPENTVTVSTSIPACFGETVTLTADYENGDYLWSNGATTQSIDVTSEGNFSVEVNVSGTTLCQVTSDSINVTFNSEIDNSVTSDATTITANLSGATYQWVDCSSSNSTIAGATNQAFAPTQDGEYAVEITVNGCTVLSECVVMSNLSIGDMDFKDALKLYPNPVKDVLHISTNTDILVEVYDLSGKLINSSKQSNCNRSIDMSSYRNGMYIVVIKAQNNFEQSSVYKIIKN